MSRPKIERASRAVAVVAALGALLAGCAADSDSYLDRRQAISLGSGDAIAANMAEQTPDPWPRDSYNNNLTFNGERMQRAVQCYRADRVTQPVDLDPTNDNAPPAIPLGQCDGPISTGSAPPAMGTAIGNAGSMAAPGATKY